MKDQDKLSILREALANSVKPPKIKIKVKIKTGQKEKEDKKDA